MHDRSLFLTSNLCSTCLCGFENAATRVKPVFVGFLYTCVSIFCSVLDYFNADKGSPIVKERLGWRLLRVG